MRELVPDLIDYLNHLPSVLVLYAKLHQKHSEHHEVRRFICFTRRSYNTITGKQITCLITSQLGFLLQKSITLCIWFRRLKMNIKMLKQLLMKKDLHMCNGRPQWQWDFKQMYHGSCASKEMLLILWLVHCCYLESMTLV